MSYQVLARKWRPGNFREMVGQEHVLKALINALDHNRLHHAYLFTGTRGVGKTTIARILAKCLNCEAGVTSTPCGECSACVEIAEGRFVDLIEVDAASRTKVEDTRELLDNVQYAPTRGRYKIYLIDEVHMLSNHSFNALLKTLEEPPEHVKFLLATTDPQKLPVTILSRCLQFNLKNMSPERIVGHLQFVLEKEAVPFEESALWLLARAADGSMRDGLSLTDQAIAFGSGKISDPDVAAMLGTIDHQLIQKLMDALIASDGRQLLQAVSGFAEHAPDFNAALADLLTLLHRVAIAQALPEALDNSFGDRKQILGYASQLAAEDVQLFYQTALIGRRDLALASDPRSGFEMTLLRMLAFRPQGVADVPSRPLSSQGQASHAPAQPLSGIVEDSDTKKSQAETVSPQREGELETAVSAASELQEPPEWVREEPPTEEPPLSHVSDVPASVVSARDPVADVVVEPVAETATREPVVTPVVDAASVIDPPVPEAPGQEARGPESHFAESQPPEPQFPETGSPESKAPESTQPSVSEMFANSSATSVRDQLKAQVKAITGREGIAPREPSAGVRQDASRPPRRSESQGELPEELAKLNAENWVHVYRALNIKGILQTTASNCVVLGVDGAQVYLALDDTKSSLFDSSHNQRLADLLSDHFQQPVKVDITLQALPEGVETPAQTGEREKKERYRDALQKLSDDPVVKTLQQQFGAVLDEQSVRYDQ